jgi:hypothetical protein
MQMELTEDEIMLIKKLREDKMLKKAVYEYFTALSGIELRWWA